MLTDLLATGLELNRKGLKGKKSMISSPTSLVIATTASKEAAAFDMYAEALISSANSNSCHVVNQYLKI